MGADFMPRLTTAAGDRQRINQLVNEQAEMGVLIAVPGVVATLTFAPWVLKLFYSEAFVHGADVARWQILGVFLRVVCWPLGYIIVALGKSAVYAVCELLFGVASVLLVVPCIHLSGLVGIGISFAVVYLFYSVMVFLVARRLTGFFWSSSALAIILGGSLILALTFACVSLLPLWWGTTVGLVITVFSAVTSFLMLQKLLRIDLWDLARQKLAPLRA